MEQTSDRAEAVRQLVSGYSGSLYRLAFAYLKNRHDAEDAVQEVFLAYLDKAPRFLSEAHEKAWLIRVTINRCKNQLRSGWFKSRRPLPEELPVMIQQESELLRAVMDLDEKYRVPIHLHYYEGYSIKEISELLGDKPATVGTRLARGREMLKVWMGGRFDE